MINLSQRLSFKEKTANNYEKVKSTIDKLLSISSAQHSANSMGEYNRKLSNYRLFNNQLDQRDFEKECNPLGLSVGQFKDEIQPYNKSANKIHVLLGEERTRPFNFMTLLTNAEGIRSKLDLRSKQLREYAYALATQDLQGPEAPQNPEQLRPYSDTNYLEAREILAGKILKYLTLELDIPDIKSDAWKHYLLAGQEIVLVEELNNEPVLTLINPLSYFGEKSNNTKYFQDGSFAGHKVVMTTSQILDNFDISEENYKLLIEGEDHGYTLSPPANDLQYFYDNIYRYEGSHVSDSSQLYEREHMVSRIEWKSQKKVAFVTFLNEYQEQETTILSEDFELPEDAKAVTMDLPFNKKVKMYTWKDLKTEYVLEYKWLPEVWQAYRIDKDIYLEMGPKKHQFRDADNPYKVKLGYHGVDCNAMNATPISIMDRMKPFQYLYFIIMHKLKKLIAQDKGKIFHFDISMVDPKVGLEKTMYYLTELNIDFFNPLQNAESPGAYQRGKVASSTDMSTTQNILYYINLLASIDQQISDVAGVTRQREGQVGANEAVSNAQTNIQLSAVVTEPYFAAHETVWEHILTSLVECARLTWKGRKIYKQFVLDDFSIATLELSPDELENAQIGVFIKSSYEENRVFKTLEQLAQALIQNDKINAKHLVKMLKATSVEELEEQMEFAQQEQQQMQAQQAQQQIEGQKQIQQEQQAFELEKQARDHANKIRLAEIDVFKFQEGLDANNNGVPDPLEIEKLKLQKQKMDNDKNFAEQKLQLEKAKLRQPKK